MRVLITAGGTTEPIDGVRGVTNHSTGKLGALIAQNFFNNGHEVDYITTKKSVLVKGKRKLHTHFIQTTEDLKNTLENLMKEHKYDAVIHSMAVSDYRTRSAVSKEEFLNIAEEKLSKSDDIRQALNAAFEVLAGEFSTAKKMPSSAEELVVNMEKTPKIIRQIKEWQPETILVGFKLLVEVSVDELLRVGLKSLHENKANFVLANDLMHIEGDNHLGLLIHPDGSYEISETKQHIAKTIVKTVEHKARKIHE